MADIESFDQEGVCTPATKHCMEHTGYAQQVKNIDEKVSGKLNVLISIVSGLVILIISFGSYLVTKTSAQAEKITLIEERQRIVIEWKVKVDDRLDLYERNLNYKGGMK